MMQEVLLDIDSVVVLDVDIIVRRDLYKLHHQDNFDKFFIAGIIDSDTFSITLKRDYCQGMNPLSCINAGVMVMNLENMRKENATQLMSERFAKSNCRPRYPEQDVLNVSLSDRIKYITTRWDIGPGKGGYYNKKFMPFITHYMGDKPWQHKYKDMIDTNQPIDDDIKLWWAYSDLVDSIVM